MALKLRIGANPIIVKELRSRMRGARAFVTLTGTLLLLGVVSYGLYRIVIAATRFNYSPLSPQIGQALFAGIAILELMMICAITPAVSAGVISSERENQTYEMLMATPLQPSTILWGKLIAALSYVLLLIFASIPMSSLVFTFGGVDPRDMIKVLITLITVAVTFGVMGVFMSAWLGRTGRATVLSYLFVLALVIGPLFIYALVGVFRGAEPPRWILIPNPVSALFSAFTSGGPTSGPLEVIGGLGMLLSGNIGLFEGNISGIPRPLYHYTLPLYAAVSLVLYLLTTRLVRPTRRWRLSKKDVLVFITLILLLIGSVALVFWSTTDRYEKVSVFTAPTPFPEMFEVRVEKEIIVAPPPPKLQPVEQPYPPPPSSAPNNNDAAAYPPPLGTESGVSFRPGLTPVDQIAIYAAAVRQMYVVDKPLSSQGVDLQVVYLVKRTYDGVAEPGTKHTKETLLADATQTGITAVLGDIPAEIKWVDYSDEISRDGVTGMVVGGGVIITLGNIHIQEDDKVLVPASLYYASPGTIGKTYLVIQMNGVWKVTGDTGVEWID